MSNPDSVVARLLWPHVQVVALLISAIASPLNLFSGRLSAQCQEQWQPIVDIAGIDGPVRTSLEWDPDGSGPLPSVLILGGEFRNANNVAAANIVAFDPVTRQWSALGGGTDGEVLCLASMPNGDLLVGGAFDNAGGVPSNSLARWNGSSWAAHGGLTGTFGTGVESLAFLSNGDLVIGGSLPFGPGPMRYLARYDGVGWLPFGSGSNGPVHDLLVVQNGDLVATGGFSAIAGATLLGIARWDGSNWSSLGAGLGSTGMSLAAMPNGDLVVGGDFATAGPVLASRVARWDGSSWAALGSGLDSRVSTVLGLANGDVVVSGMFQNAGGSPAAGIARWDGTSWSPMATTGWTGSVNASTIVELPSGELIVGHQTPASTYTKPGTGVMRWDGARWTAVGDGIDLPPDLAVTMPNGDLVIGGSFQRIDRVSTRGIARWDGATWSALGSGMDDSVEALLPLPNGDLIAGGRFSSAGGVPAAGIARWDGSSWSPIGAGVAGTGSNVGVFDLVLLPNGDLVAGGWFSTAGGVAANNIARWDGSSWSPLGSGLENGNPSFVSALLVRPNGALVVGGRFDTAGGMAVTGLASWSNGIWGGFSPFSSYSQEVVRALGLLPNGRLVVGGQIRPFAGNTSQNIASEAPWGWAGYGAGLAPSQGDLLILPNGDVVGYEVPTGLLDERLVRWQGSSWQAIASPPGVSPRFYCERPDGSVVVGGVLRSNSGPNPSPLIRPFLARLTTNCPATTVNYGAGCVGSAGLNTLTALTLPWTGSTFRAQADGIAAGAIAVNVLGFGTSNVPLSTIVPQGAAGCTLLVTPFAQQLILPSNGAAATSLAIPGSSSLAGVVLRQQVGVLDLDPQGNLLAATSTNGLTVTIGTF